MNRPVPGRSVSRLGHRPLALDLSSNTMKETRPMLVTTLLRSLTADSELTGLLRKHRRNNPNRRTVRRWAVERLEGRTLLSTMLVTTIDDSGPGSLRQAIVDVNNDTSNPATDTIAFAIPGTGRPHDPAAEPTARHHSPGVHRRLQPAGLQPEHAGAGRQCGPDDRTGRQPGRLLVRPRDRGRRQHGPRTGRQPLPVPWHRH